MIDVVHNYFILVFKFEMWKQLKSAARQKLTADSYYSPAESRDDNSVYDLFELIQVPRKNHGVTLVKGDDPYSPAYKILNPDLIPPVPESAFRDLIDSIHAERGFLLLLNFKQFKRTRGSLLTVEKNDGSGPVFEIVSNGKANTLDIVFSTENKQQVVSIEDVDLATNHWRNITLFVQEDRAQLYAGCDEVNTAELDAPIQSILTPETPSSAQLRIGKGAVKDRFMVRARAIIERRFIALWFGDWPLLW